MVSRHSEKLICAPPQLSFPNVAFEMVPLCILGISIDVSSPTHDPRCAGELLFLFRAIVCMLNTEGPSRSLWESPRAVKGQWMSFWSPSAWHRPAYSQTASVCNCLSQQPFSLKARGSTVGRQLRLKQTAFLIVITPQHMQSQINMKQE